MSLPSRSPKQPSDGPTPYPAPIGSLMKTRATSESLAIQSFDYVILVASGYAVISANKSTRIVRSGTTFEPWVHDVDQQRVQVHDVEFLSASKGIKCSDPVFSCPPSTHRQAPASYDHALSYCCVVRSANVRLNFVRVNSASGYVATAARVLSWHEKLNCVCVHVHAGATPTLGLYFAGLVLTALVRTTPCLWTWN